MIIDLQVFVFIICALLLMVSFAAFCLALHVKRLVNRVDAIEAELTFQISELERHVRNIQFANNL